MKRLTSILTMLAAVAFAGAACASDPAPRKECKLPDRLSMKQLGGLNYEDIARAAGAQECDEVVDPDLIADREAQRIVADSAKPAFTAPESQTRVEPPATQPKRAQDTPQGAPKRHPQRKARVAAKATCASPTVVPDIVGRG